MRRLLPVLVLLLAPALAGCGGSSAPPATTSATASAPAAATPAAAMAALAHADPTLAGRLQTLFIGSGWSVVESIGKANASAVVFHLVGGSWQPDRSRRVSITILGPNPGSQAVRLPQVAIEITAKTPFVESALWVDGTELAEQGGGTPTRGTIYGAPAHALKPGLHVAVGYARTATTGSAVAWTFRVP